MSIRYKLRKSKKNLNSREAILRQMSDGEWYSLKELAFVAGITEAGASARIRDLRKPRFGGFTVETTPSYGNEPWLYRLARS